MANWIAWDAATWQGWVAAHWGTIALVVAGLVLLMALLTVAARPVTRARRGEFAGAMPPASLEGAPADRRADILRAIDEDYASGRIDRVEWERRRHGR